MEKMNYRLKRSRKVWIIRNMLVKNITQEKEE